MTLTLSTTLKHSHSGNLGRLVWLIGPVYHSTSSYKLMWRRLSSCLSNNLFLLSTRLLRMKSLSTGVTVLNLMGTRRGIVIVVQA